MTGKSQALNTWLKEFIFNILIQPFHCIIYMVFSTIIISILGNGSSLGGGLLVIVIMIFMRQAEGIVRSIFGFGNAKSLGDVVAAGALLASSMKTAGSVLGKMKGAKTADSKGSGKSSTSGGTGTKKPNLKDTSNVGSSNNRSTPHPTNNNSRNSQSSSAQGGSEASNQQSSSQGGGNSQNKQSGETNSTSSMQSPKNSNSNDVERSQREYNTEVDKANKKFRNTLGNILVGANKKAFELASGVGIGGAFSGDIPGIMTATNFASAATGAAGTVKDKVVSGGRRLKNWATSDSRINAKTNNVIDAYNNLKNEKNWSDDRMLDETERVLNINDTSKIKDEKLREYAETVQNLRTEYEGKYQVPNDVVLDRVTKIQSGDIQKKQSKTYTRAPKTRPINRPISQNGNNANNTRNANNRANRNNRNGRGGRSNRNNTRRP